MGGWWWRHRSSSAARKRFDNRVSKVFVDFNP
jgi:hypothetical protein